MLDKKRVRIDLEFRCTPEYDNTDPENPVLVTGSRDVADNTLATLVNYANNQTPPGIVRSQQRDMGEDISLEARLIFEVDRVSIAGSIYSTLESNIDNFPSLVENGVRFVFSAN